MSRGTLLEDGESSSQVSPYVQKQFTKTVFNVCKAFVGAKTIQDLHKIKIQLIVIIVGKKDGIF
jgi:hypothetical protein